MHWLRINFDIKFFFTHLTSKVATKHCQAKAGLAILRNTTLNTNLGLMYLVVLACILPIFIYKVFT